MQADTQKLKLGWQTSSELRGGAQIRFGTVCAVGVYLPDGVPLMVANGNGAVVAAESQQVVGAPAATGDSLGVFT